MDERCERVAAATREVGADTAVLSAFDSVCYATGYVIDLESGPSAFAAGPPIALAAGPDLALVLSNAEEGPAPRARRAFTYEGFSAEREPPRDALYVDSVLEAAADLGIGGVVAVEPTTLPLAVAEALRSRVERFVDIRPALARQRAIKTAEEIELLRDCARLAGAGQGAALQQCAAGITELAAFAGIRAAIEREAGERVQLVSDLLSGAGRTGEAMGAPTNRVIGYGDAVICDLVPRHHGYWGDSCNSFAIGDEPPAFAGLYATATRAMDLVREILRPGLTAAAVDAEVRSVTLDAGYELPLHLGHGIGCANFEFPLIVPEERATLQPNMVLMLEPGAYAPGTGGVRLEWMFQVTETGNEPLSDFPFTSLAA
jgi:Xaa-Pro dipeptidase